jgi:hypothetical protein
MSALSGYIVDPDTHVKGYGFIATFISTLYAWLLRFVGSPVGQPQATTKGAVHASLTRHRKMKLLQNRPKRDYGNIGTNEYLLPNKFGAFFLIHIRQMKIKS